MQGILERLKAGELQVSMDAEDFPFPPELFTRGTKARLRRLRMTLRGMGIDDMLIDVVGLLQSEDKSLAMGGPSVVDAGRLMMLMESQATAKMSKKVKKLSFALQNEARRKWTPKKLQQLEDRLTRSQAGSGHVLSSAKRFKLLLATWLMPEQAGHMSRRPVVYCPTCRGGVRSNQRKRRGKQRLRCAKGHFIFAVKRVRTPLDFEFPSSPASIGGEKEEDVVRGQSAESGVPLFGGYQTW